MNALEKELAALEKQEKKILDAPEHKNQAKEYLYEKVPQGLQAGLEAAFTKAFQLVFLKGTWAIEKTFDKENAGLNYEAGNYVVDKAGSKKSIRRLDKGARKDNLMNHTATTIAGFGLGLLGLGLPDIPLLVSTLLKGLYEIALGYGFEYESEKEKIYILRLIRTALAGGEEKKEFNRQLDCMEYVQGGFKTEVEATAKALSDALLVEKFVQGIPLVGIVGGFVNHGVYRKVARLAGVKYKKRYLKRKLEQ